MKKIILLFFLISTKYSYSQVAINSNGQNPNTSAMLDISSSNKGLLIPRVYLSSLVDNATIPTPATSLLVYNTNTNLSKGAGFYYNSGTPASPNWQPMQDLVFPFYKGVSTNGSAFTVENFSQNASSTAIKAVAGGAGNAQEVSGKMKIAGSGQVPAQGKVLTSDANGNATWQGAVAFRAAGAKGGGSQTFAHQVEKKVAFRVVDYDISGNYRDAYTSPHSTFTAPVKGIYRFDCRLTWVHPPAGAAYYLSIKVRRNGSEWSAIEHSVEGGYVQNFGGDTRLEAGDEVFVTVQHTAGETIALLSLDNDWTASFFTGRLVIKL